MGLLLEVLLSVYFLSLLSISFIPYSLGYCLLLLGGVLSFCGFIYLVVGFSWYILLFCLVYVGGVFILLIYVSGYDFNFFVWFGCGYSVMLAVVLFFVLWCGVYSFGLVCFIECSHYLNLLDGGFSYCFFCVVLLIGFCLVSVVSGSKDSFIR